MNVFKITGYKVIWVSGKDDTQKEDTAVQLSMHFKAYISPKEF